MGEGLSWRARLVVKTTERLERADWRPEQVALFWHGVQQLFEQAVAVVPITLLLVFSMGAFFQVETNDGGLQAAGLLAAIIGLAFFVDGLRVCVMPLGELIGRGLPMKYPLPVVLMVAFCLGILVTYAEPAIASLRPLAQLVDKNQAPYLYFALNQQQEILVLCIGLGVGTAAVIGTLRFVKGWSVKPVIAGTLLPTLGAACYLQWGNPDLRPLLGLCWDCGAVTTGPVTVPILLALGIGVMKSVKQKRLALAVLGKAVASNQGQALEGFGIVTLASLFPILAVELMAIVFGSMYSKETILSTSGSVGNDTDPTEVSPVREVIFAIRAILPLNAALILVIMFILRMPLPTLSVYLTPGGALGSPPAPTDDSGHPSDSDSLAASSLPATASGRDGSIELGGGSGGDGSGAGAGIGKKASLYANSPLSKDSASLEKYSSSNQFGGGNPAVLISSASPLGPPGGPPRLGKVSLSHGRPNPYSAAEGGSGRGGGVRAGAAAAAATTTTTATATSNLGKTEQQAVAEATEQQVGSGNTAVNASRLSSTDLNSSSTNAMKVVLELSHQKGEEDHSPSSTISEVPPMAGEKGAVIMGKGEVDEESGEERGSGSLGSGSSVGGWKNWRHWPLAIGICMCLGGMILFNMGLTYGFTALGDQAGSLLPSSYLEVEGYPDSPVYSKAGGIVLTMVIVFSLGILATRAEPALLVLGRTVQALSGGQFSASMLVNAVAVGVGAGMCIGTTKILFKVPIIYIILIKYAIASFLTVFALEDFTQIAWDSAGVTTGPVTVPFVLALGIGFSKATQATEGFGILTSASVAPIISVLITNLFRRQIAMVGSSFKRTAKSGLGKVSAGINSLKSRSGQFGSGKGQLTTTSINSAPTTNPQALETNAEAALGIAFAQEFEETFTGVALQQTYAGDEDRASAYHKQKSMKRSESRKDRSTRGGKHNAPEHMDRKSGAPGGSGV